MKQSQHTAHNTPLVCHAPSPLVQSGALLILRTAQLMVDPGTCCAGTVPVEHTRSASITNAVDDARRGAACSRCHGHTLLTVKLNCRRDSHPRTCSVALGCPPAATCHTPKASSRVTIRTTAANAQATTGSTRNTQLLTQLNSLSLEGYSAGPLP